MRTLIELGENEKKEEIEGLNWREKRSTHLSANINCDPCCISIFFPLSNLTAYIVH